MPSVPPTGGKDPSEHARPTGQPQPPSGTSGDIPAPPATKGGGNSAWEEMMAVATPEQRKKIMNGMCQMINQQIAKDNKKALKEIKKQRENIEKGE